MSDTDAGYVNGSETGITIVSRTQRIVVHSSRAISVISAGPQGPMGRPGAKGDPGDPGAPGLPGNAVNAAFVWDQGVPSADWGPIPHMLGYDPAGFVLQDTAGTTYEGFDVEYIDVNHLTIHLGVSLGGRVRMS